MLAGCSTTFFASPDLPAASEPADYQALVAKDVASLKDRASMGVFEISPLRRTRLAQPGDWMVCLRTTQKERPTYIAMFLREGRIVHTRLAVAVDYCAHEDYQPLPGT